MCNDNPSLSMKKELVIDIEKLPARTARELEKYVKSKIPSVFKMVKKKQKKNQLGFSGENDTTNNQFVPESSNQNEHPINSLLINENMNNNSKDNILQEEEEVVKSTTNAEQNQKENNGQSSDSSFFTESDSEEEKK